jgi:hypothetical protein
MLINGIQTIIKIMNVGKNLDKFIQVSNNET